MLDRIKSKKQRIDVIDEEKNEPIEKEDMVKAIKLIEAAHSIQCEFQLDIHLFGREVFTITSDTFQDIKLNVSKKDGDKVSIQYGDMIFSHDTHIGLNSITNVVVKCKYSSEGDNDV